MDKKLTRTEYALALGVIFLMVLALGAFFYGYHLGSKKTESRYAAVLENLQAKEGKLDEYHQQYLFSFYHTIYSPYLEFHKKWFEHLHTIELGHRSVDPSSLLKELEMLAEQQYEYIQGQSTPLNSPLLGEAHQNYLKSLKSFQEALHQLRREEGDLSGRDLAQKIQNDTRIQNAQQYALNGQKLFYMAMVKWHATVDPLVEEQMAVIGGPLETEQWKQLYLTVKNAYIAELMEAGGYFRPYSPQDVTIRVDEIVNSGNTPVLDTLGTKEVGALAQLLITTDAVRENDFQKNKAIHYKNELLPQLPVFLE